MPIAGEAYVSMTVVELAPLRLKSALFAGPLESQHETAAACQLCSKSALEVYWPSFKVGGAYDERDHGRCNYGTATGPEAEGEASVESRHFPAVLRA